MSVKAWEEKNIGEWEHEYALLLEYADGLTGLLPDGDGQIIWDDYSYMSLKAEMYRVQHPGTRVHLVKRRCEIVSVEPDKRPGDAHGVYPPENGKKGHSNEQKTLHCSDHHGRKRDAVPDIVGHRQLISRER